MNRRLEQFIAAENISQSELAENLGVARASISHIISGRNRPGFDFIESMALRYPALNLEWLITGKGRMYKFQGSSTDQQQSPSSLPKVDSIFEATEPVTGSLFEENEPDETSETQVPVQQSPSAEDFKEKNIEKIIVFYSDGTFREIE